MSKEVNKKRRTIMLFGNPRHSYGYQLCSSSRRLLLYTY